MIAQIAEAPAAHAAVAPQLTRYPYLTDVVQTFATVNFATDRSNTTAKLKYGKVGQESCTAHSVYAVEDCDRRGHRLGVPVEGEAHGSDAEREVLLPDLLRYHSIDLLGGDPSPQFWSALPAGSNQSYSFAVFGDWGDTDQQGNNPQQAALNASLGASGVRFALATGDTAYDSGSQLNYGDLNQTGFRVSSIFRPELLAAGGRLGPAVQRAREPRRERDVLHELATGAGGPSRAASTRWRRTAARTTPSRRARRARGTRSTRGTRGSTC